MQCARCGTAARSLVRGYPDYDIGSWISSSSVARLPTSPQDYSKLKIPTEEVSFGFRPLSVSEDGHLRRDRLMWTRLSHPIASSWTLLAITHEREGLVVCVHKKEGWGFWTFGVWFCWASVERRTPSAGSETEPSNPNQFPILLKQADLELGSKMWVTTKRAGLRATNDICDFASSMYVLRL
ncbi:hypothetical protein BJ508DRAFT_377010 [Ascobolus immersus RN42]|uniref:Uncharacterized protein n=1 Tax=Ascobolus immersus RN42 TaxID=1160509 RepID=A0A3N4I5F1_ASCIM|nr:hypothetical protein BJ508DRAFT_377010 [Ascobolus immersus RN42]